MLLPETTDRSPKSKESNWLVFLSSEMEGSDGITTIPLTDPIQIRHGVVRKTTNGSNSYQNTILSGERLGVLRILNHRMPQIPQ